MSNPTEHIDYVLENGMDAWALTDHGHANGFPHAHQKEKELKAKGVKFKYLPGVEAYCHPDLDEWRATKARIDEEKKDAKKQSRREAIESGDDGSTSENEEATKDVSKWNNPINRRHHIVLLAKSRKGLQNIFRLVSRSHLQENFYRFPRIDYKMLKECGEDVIVSTACIGGTMAWDTLTQFQGTPFDDLKPGLLDDRSALEAVMSRIGNTYDRLTDAVGVDNVFTELQFNRLPPQHLVNRALLEFHKRTNAQLVATVDSHYCRPELWREREIYKKLGRLNYEQINPELIPKDVSQLKCELYPKNAEQMWSSYRGYCGEHSFYDDQLVSDAIERTWHIAHDVIGDVQPDTRMKLPSFVVPPGMSAFQALVEHSKEGLRRKQLHVRPEYVQRLKHELGVIDEKDFSAYFLTMKAIMDIAHSQQLVGAGRGSGAGSLVCYVLGLTQIDPLKYGLLFERFISAARSEYPDIDTDLADRDMLIDAMREKFSTENVIPISNFNTLQIKSLIKDISRLYAIPYDEANAATKRLDDDVKPHAMQAGENKSIFQLKYDDCLQYSPAFAEFIQKYPHVGENVKVLYKQNKSLGRHAGGILVTEDAESNLPLIASKGEIQSPWAEGMHVKHLEKYGFVKFDLLGLETLRIIQRAIELIMTRHEGRIAPGWTDVKKWYDEHLHPDVMRTDDPKVFKSVFHKGRFAGIFQFTAKHTQKFITKFHPESVYDLAVATSIYRPGPLAGKVDKLYIEAKQNPQSVRFDHPALEKVLGPTLGFLVFQEQLMAVAHELAGMSLDDCDRLRKAIVKRSVSGQAGQKTETETLREMFIEGAVMNRYPRDKALKLYDEMKAWASYGFNCSHAVAYSFCSYQCAWLMTYYEPEWLCAYMETMVGNDDDRATAISEIRSLGYSIGQVDINRSGYAWEIGKDDKTLIPSFRTVDGIGDIAISEITQNRPYASLENLLWDDKGKWKHSKFNKRGMENLIKIGGFESLDLIGPGKPFDSYRHMHAVVIEHQPELKKKNGRELLSQLIADARGLEDWTKIEKLAFQKEIVGDVDVSAVISQEKQERLAKLGCPSIDDHPGGRNLCWFVLVDRKPLLTKTQKPYLLMFALGPSGTQHKVFLWDAPPSTELACNTAYLAEIEKKGGFISTKLSKLKRVEE